jgi:CheY-like chemotaxis protein
MVVEDRLAALIVDDDQDIRETLREVLQEEGFPVACAANGEDALAQLTTMPRPGLIVLDLMMPVMSGWDFLARLHADKALAGIPVVVVTASGGRALPAGATCLLRKPIDLDTILDLVREHCGAASCRWNGQANGARFHS